MLIPAQAVLQLPHKRDQIGLLFGIQLQPQYQVAMIGIGVDSEPPRAEAR